jgi:hypothetical protein
MSAVIVEHGGHRATLGDFIAETLRLARTHEAMIGEYTEHKNLNHLTARFDAISRHLHVLQTLYSCFEDWPTTIYLLKQTARGAFAREQYEEGVFHKGEGCNGKGWFDAVLTKAFGSYIYHPGQALLTSPWPGGDRPSPHLLGCKGRRFVSITEAERSGKGTIISSSYKILRDHSSILSARNLYKDMTSFRVQFMMQLSTNVTTAFTSLDGGIERSLAVVPWPFRFVRRPAAEDERHIDSSLKSEAVVAKHAVELVYLLMLVDAAWKDFDDCRVSPMPTMVQEATKKFLMKDTEDQVSLFVHERTEVVDDVRGASTDAQIVRALRSFLQLKGAKGLQESREALEAHFFAVTSDGRRLMRPKGRQSGYVGLKAGMDVD